MANRLAARAGSSVRGIGSGSFVYATRDDRAIELSKNGEEWWLEVWAGEEVAGVRFIGTTEEAAEAAEQWLAGGGS